MTQALPFTDTRKSQNALILAWFLEGHELTQLEALNKFGCLRLGARRDDLRKLGWNVQSEIIAVGRKHVARYWIPLDNQRCERKNGHKKPSLKQLAKDYLETLQPTEKIHAALTLSGFIIWMEKPK